MLFLLASSVLGLLSFVKLVAAIAFCFRLQLPQQGLKGRITLLLPLSGSCPALLDLMQALGAQTLQPYKLLIAVESTDDPAYVHAREAVAKAGFPVEIYIAGPADHCGQKCWNQIAALRRLDGKDDAVVLFDADIEPQPFWLSLLATPILADKADVVTGYRWNRINRQTFTQHLVAVIDRGIAILPSLDRAQLTWGGSIALSTRALAALDLPALLSRSLSDDCSIGMQTHCLGLRVLTRRLLRVPSRPENNFFSAWNFGHRQYQIINVYRKSLWHLALTTLTVRLCSWGAIFLTFSTVNQLMATLFILLMLSLTVTALQQAIARRLGMHDDLPTICGQCAFTLLEPLTTLIHWSIIAVAARTTDIRWGHIHYRIHAPDNIEVVSRSPWECSSNNNTKGRT